MILAGSQLSCSSPPCWPSEGGMTRCWRQLSSLNWLSSIRLFVEGQEKQQKLCKFEGEMSGPVSSDCKSRKYNNSPADSQHSTRGQWSHGLQKSLINSEIIMNVSLHNLIFSVLDIWYCVPGAGTNVWVFWNNIYHYTNLCLTFVTQDFSCPFHSFHICLLKH